MNKEITESRVEELHRFEQNLGYTYKDLDLLVQVLVGIS